MNATTTFDMKRSTFELNRGSETHKSSKYKHETGSSFANDEQNPHLNYNMYESRLGYANNNQDIIGHHEGSYQHKRHVNGNKSVNILLKPINVVTKQMTEDT